MPLALPSTSIRRRTVAGIVSTAIALSLLPGSLRAQTPPQSVTVLQYRHVPAEHVSEFLYRETTYWSKVAQKAVDSGKMTFWALLEQVGGNNLPNSPNYLFINTVPNVDALGDVFNPTGMFPGVPMSSIGTDSISTTTSVYFLSMADVTAAAGVDPARDFKYLALNYHNSSSPSAFLGLEREHWLPFIKTAMDRKQTAQVGWTHGALIAPRGDGIGFNTVSVDLYPSLHKVLMPGWASDVTMPGDGLDKLNAIRLGQMGTAIYRIVHVVSAN
jgi:hypothetical protein